MVEATISVTLKICKLMLFNVPNPEWLIN